jgi:hypothetical protein
LSPVEQGYPTTGPLLVTGSQFLSVSMATGQPVVSLAVPITTEEQACSASYSIRVEPPVQQRLAVPNPVVQSYRSNGFI